MESDPHAANTNGEPLDPLTGLNLPRGISRNGNPKEDALPLPPRGRQPPPLVGAPKLYLSEGALRQMMEWAAQETVTRMMGAQTIAAPRANEPEEGSLSSIPMPSRTPRHSIPATQLDDHRRGEPL